MKKNLNLSEEEEKRSIGKTAAKLIRADIILINSSKEIYPTLSSR
jgi:DeoR/GlpR family transcriptional regulator of sugar metabolism